MSPNASAVDVAGRVPSDELPPRLRIAWIGCRGVPAHSDSKLGGGIERAVEELGRRLAARGHDLTVYCRSYYTRDRGDFEGIHRVVLPTIPSKHLDTIVHTALATAHALTKSYDVIQYFALGPSLLAWAPRIRGVRSVASIRALDWQREKWGWLARTVLRLGERAAMFCPNATSSVSPSLKSQLERRYGRTVAFVPNGVAPPRFRPPRRITELNLSPSGYLLFVGRLVPEKGCHDLLRAFACVPTEKLLVLAGSPSYSSDYVAQLRRLAGPRVRFVGHVTGELLEELYSHAYLCILPSHVEGLSNSLLEALSYERCTLVSDIPENLAIVQGHAPSFRCGDVDDLARELTTLLADPGRVAETGKRAGEFVLQYSWDAAASATEALYCSLRSA